jgi:tryptophan halogenase
LVDSNKTIVIVGAGTASWIAASAFYNFSDTSKIILIEGSKKTIGVGEGTTPHFAQVLRTWLNVTDEEFFKETGSTIKLGVLYQGWGKEDYFNPIDKEFRNNIDPNIWPDTVDAKRVFAVAKDYPVCTSPFLDLCKNNQVPSSNETYAYHFDQALVADFFKKRLPQVTLIDQDVVDVKVSNGKIDQLVLSNGNIVQGDLYIDATGFSRVLISKLGAKWRDFSSKLPLTSALAYSVPKDDIIQPYTSATTYPSGWHWTIPLQNRKGCGFLYNADIDTVEDIKKYLPDNAYDVRTIKFTPGCLDRSFIGNCLAVGLSSGFVEPLEATSIHSTIIQLWLWVKDFHSNNGHLSHAEKLWNKHHNDYWHSVLDWIQLHYCNVSAKGKFWDHMATVERTERVKEILDLCKLRTPRSGDLDNPYLIWQHSLTMNILQGNNVLDPQLAQYELDSFNIEPYARHLYAKSRSAKIQGYASNAEFYR